MNNALLTGKSLGPGEKIVSPNESFEFRYQDDGNLVLYQGTKPVWATMKFSNNPGKCIMQKDGNLVCENNNHDPYWASGSYERLMETDAHLVVQDDGNAVIYKTVPIWATWDKGVPDFINPHNWMETLGHMINKIPLNRLKLICSHDAGTYTAIDALGWIKCQKINIKEQLLSGARVLDLRIAYNPFFSGRFFIAHHIAIMTDVTIEKVLDQVKEFLNYHDKEVVVLDFPRVENFMGNTQYEKFHLEDETFHNKLAEIIITTLGSSLFSYSEWKSKSINNFPTLDDIWKTSGRIIVTWDLNGNGIEKPSEFFPPIKAEWEDNLYTETDLFNFINKKILEPHSNDIFWSMCGVLKQIGSIKAKGRIVSLSNELRGWFDLRSEWLDKLNILSVNFVEENASVIRNTIIKNSYKIGGNVMSDRLLTNQFLRPGQKIVSPNESFEFRYQDDGNLVLYQGTKPVWATMKFSSNPGKCIMQEDGNLVCEDKNHDPYWASGSYERFAKTDAHLVVQDDGNVVIYKTNPIWDTYHHPQK
jgi:hypothetical protein